MNVPKMKYLFFISILFFTACKGLMNSDYEHIQEIEVNEIDKLKAKEKGLILMDVRTPEEVADGSIDGAIFLNYFDDNFKSELVKMDTSKTYLVYCRSGNRSGKACKIMSDLGFSNLYNLNGGYNAYKASK